MPRFMVMVRAHESSEAGVMPDAQLLAEMGRFNEELVRAGVMEAGEGLHPSSRGARVHFDGDRRTVQRGPFPVHETVSGFWLWTCSSLDEALEWAKKCPNPMPGPSDLEIRQVFSAEDFGEALTPALREQEDRLRAEVERRREG